jgi:hypothetical protein
MSRDRAGTSSFGVDEPDGIEENTTPESQEAVMEYEVAQDQDHSERWVAQAIDFEGEGEVYTVLFVGRDAEHRAHEYAEWQNARLRQGVAAD